MILSLLNLKGGVGKTTLAVHIATGLAQRDFRCLLIDSDKQGSALDWAANREEKHLFTVIGLPKPTLYKEIGELAKDYIHVIIDCPPFDGTVTRSALMSSDVVIIPVQPSPLDVWASEDTVKLVTEALPIKEKLKYAFVINRRIVNTAIGRDVVEILSRFEFPILDSHVHQRVAFPESFAKGSTVLEIEPGNLAAKEIDALVTEILTL